MLTPVHAPHFSNLAHRLEQTIRLSIGQTPTTVAVFDDADASREFCRKHSRHCGSKFFVQLDLRSLVGDAAYSIAQGMLRTGGYQSRERLQKQRFPDDPLAKECFPKFGGQCYQSLKKFYGAAEGPSHCKVFWVTDAESYPFRPFNFSALVAPTLRHHDHDERGQHHGLHDHGRHKPFLLVPTWYPDRYGCSSTVNLYDDADCAVWIASGLSLGSDNSMGAQLSGLPTSYLSGSKRAYQTVYDLNNWWFYDRMMARAVIDRTEQQIGGGKKQAPFHNHHPPLTHPPPPHTRPPPHTSHTGKHFVDYFASLQVPDINFWRANLEYLVKQPGSPMGTRDYLRLLEKNFPEAFAQCCSCRRIGAQANTTTPCYALTDLWSPCFLSHTSPKRLAGFLIEQLGIFGIFGNEIDQVPDAVLKADQRLSWVVNNAYKWKGAFKYAPETHGHKKGKHS